MINQSYSILAIEAASFYNFVHAEDLMLQKIMSMDPKIMAGYDDDDDDEEEKISRLLQMHEGVAVISIDGMLTNSNSWINRWFGMVSYDEIRIACLQAIDQGAKAALFRISSPGGNVEGLADTANLISNMPMETIAFTSSRMMSAAYFLGSQCDNLYCDSFADVGSIGVIIKLYDRSGMLADMKVKPMRFRSGPLKATGDGDFKLSAEEMKYIQEKVTITANKFFDIVSEARGMPREVLDKLEITSGRTYIGEEALGVNLVDSIKTFDESMLKAYDIVKKVDNSNNTRLF